MGSNFVLKKVATNASDILLVPTGNVSSTTVQAAIGELDAEKLAKANNLSDVVDPVTAFNNIKQAATESASGVVQLATSAEVLSGIEPTKAITSATLNAKVPNGTTTGQVLVWNGTTYYVTLPQTGLVGLTTTDSPTFATVKLSNLTDGYIPKHTSDAIGLVNSPIYTDGTNVGIGTVNVSIAKLNVENSLLVRPSTWGTSGSGIVYLGDTNNYIRSTFGSTTDIGSYNAVTIINGITPTEKVRILTNGNVGIGTTTPASKTSISGNLSVGVTYANIAAPTNGAIFEGNVGIGTTSPGAKLDVNNDLKIGTMRFSFQDYSVTLDSTHWYRILTLPATNSGQYVKAVIWQPLGHDHTIVELRKNTTGNGMGWTAKAYKGGAYEYPHNVSNIRVVDDGCNAATHIDIQVGSNVSNVPFKISLETNVYNYANTAIYDGFSDQGIAAVGVVFPVKQVVDSWGSCLSSVPIMTIKGNGNVGIGTSSPTSKLHVVGLPAYANNAAAVSAGLTVGAFYRTGGDPDVVCVVH